MPWGGIPPRLYRSIWEDKLQTTFDGFRFGYAFAPLRPSENSITMKYSTFKVSQKR